VEVTIQKIEKEVEDCALRHYGSTFRFRPNQKEAVVNTVYSWLSGSCTDIILQGPTGSGKSAIGLLAAAVMSEFYGKKGYIVISDLSLIKQYEKDVERFFPKWSVIKGQDNYICHKNGLPFTAGECKLKGCKSYKDIFMKFPDCSSSCQYIQERLRAMNSDVVICTYAFWLIQQNLVKPMVDNPPFTTRDFTILDEAHKLVGIVQSYFSPKLSESDEGKFINIMNSVGEVDSEVITDIKRIRENIFYSEDNQVIFDNLKEYVEKVVIVADNVDAIMRELREKLERGEEMSKEDKNLVHNCNFVEEHLRTFGSYVGIIESTGIDNMVKNPQSESVIAFNCIEESYLMGRYFHRNAKNKLYMSATIGEASAYAKEVATEKYLSIDIPSTFDFTNSPIFYIDTYKLSYKEKETSLPRIIELIIATINMYQGKRGIIQTGSYDFAKKLYFGVPDDIQRRLILYDDSKGKDEAIFAFKASSDKILVGPSLIEGLSFDDDLCRFQIIMKIPYPSLADKFVSAKQKIRPEWYSNTTAISILQGVGRGIRSEHDWCVTFIFDGCFTNLARQSYKMFPDEFKRRIKIIQPKDILGG